MRTASGLFGVHRGDCGRLGCRFPWLAPDHSGEVVQKAPASALIIEIATITVDPRAGYIVLAWVPHCHD